MHLVCGKFRLTGVRPAALALALMALLACGYPSSVAATVDEKVDRRAQSIQQFKKITLALQFYHDTHGSFPPASIVGSDGKTRYSWRVALLPFLEKDQLFLRYRRNEPWDSEHNKTLIAEGAQLFGLADEQGKLGDCC